MRARRPESCGPDVAFRSGGQREPRRLHPGRAARAAPCDFVRSRRGTFEAVRDAVQDEDRHQRHVQDPKVDREGPHGSAIPRHRLLHTPHESSLLSREARFGQTPVPSKRRLHTSFLIAGRVIPHSVPLRCAMPLSAARFLRSTRSPRGRGSSIARRLIARMRVRSLSESESTGVRCGLSTKWLLKYEGLGEMLARPRGQRMLAMPTRVRREFDHRVHAVDWHQWPRMPGMPRLTARLASTLRAPAARALLARESIGLRRLRCRRRVLLA
jgi:hypothetical protein